MLRQVAYLLLFGAVVSGAMLARTRPRYAPVFLLLYAGLLADGLRLALPPLPEGGAHVGADRVIFHARQLAFLLWPFSLTAAHLRVFVHRWSVLPLPVLLLVFAVCVLGYPDLGDVPLQRVYVGADLLCVMTCCLSLARWWRTSHRANPEHACLVILLAAEVVSLALGPWRGSVYTRWDLAVLLYVLAFGGVAALQGVVLWKRSSSSSR